MKKVYIIHENDEWTVHLTKRLKELNIPFEEWHLDKGTINLSEMPPEGIYYNRMSASSHTRGHRFAPELALSVLYWLERHNRKVFNGTRALHLEVSKVAQYMALNRKGIATPYTIAAVGKEQVLEAAKQMSGKPFITKHNRAGKGLGVRLFYSYEGLLDYVEGPEYEESVDGITLIQEYIQSPLPYITRCEFIDSQFVYAVQVNTSEGFELCPADACQIGDIFCPVGENSNEPKFKIVENFTNPIIEKYQYLLKEENIQVAGIEFIRDQDGTIYTYDINTNTNYNADAENLAGKFGMLELARFLGRELERLE